MTPRVLTEQTEIELASAADLTDQWRAEYVRKLQQAGIRPPERWEEAPEDHSPPVTLRRGISPLIGKLKDRLKR